MRTKNSLKSRLEISNEEDKSANETRKSKRVNKTKISPPPKENASKTLSAFDYYLSSDDELFDKKSKRTNFRRQKRPVASNLKKKCEDSVVVGVECKKPVKTKCKTHIDSQATVTGACYSGRPYKKLYDKDINRNSAGDIEEYVTTVSCEDKDRKGTSVAFSCVSKRQTYDYNSDVSSETLKSAGNRKEVRDEKSALLQVICSSADEHISDKQSHKSSISLNVMCQKSSERQPILCCNDEASVSCSRSSYKASQMVSNKKFDKMSDLVGRCQESQRETIKIGTASTSSCSINSFPHTERTSDKELHRAKNIEFSNNSLQRDSASSRSCPVCNMIFPDFMTQDESNRHVNSCLDISKKAMTSMDNPSFNKEYLDAKSSTPMNKSDEELARDLQRREQEKYLEERLSDGLFFCSFCQKNLSNMNPGTRQTHMNKCADLQDKLMAESKKAEKKLLAKGNTGEFECFICGLRFSSMKSRISHMKLCCKEKSVSPKDVLSLMKCELSNSKLTRDPEDPANRKSDTRGLDGKDENEITTAVSNVNVLKSFGKNTVAANTNAGKKRKVNRKKRHEEVPALLTRNEEKAKDLLMKKAACIIAQQLEMSNAREPVCSLPPSTLAKKYLKSYSHKGNGSCSSFASRPFDDPTESDVDSNQCTRVTKEATNQDLSLWNLAAINTADTTLSPFYVQDVFNEDYISMEKVKHQKSLAVKSPVSPSSNANRNEEESVSHDDEEVPKISESERSEVDKVDDASNVGASFAMTQQEKAAVLDQLGCARMDSQPNDESDMEQSNATKRRDEADSIHCSGFCRPSDIEEPDIQKMLQSYKKEAQDSLMEDMKILLADESTKDVKIKCCDGEIRAHSLILRIRCPQLLKVASNGDIPLTESSSKAVQCLLAHLYTGSIDFRSDLMTEISSLANRFSLDKLSEVCNVIQKKTECLANNYYETNDLDETVNVLIKDLWENEDSANDNNEPSEFENSGENSEFDENDAEDLRTYFATQRERRSSDACAARRVSDIEMESHCDIDLLLSDKYEEKTKSDSCSCAHQNEFFYERCAMKQCDPEVRNHSDTDSVQSGRGSVHAKMSSNKGEELCPIENTGDSKVKSRNDGVDEFSEETQDQCVLGKSEACSNNNSICFGNSFNVSLDEIPMITAEEAADIHIISDSEVFSSFLQRMTDPVDDIAEAVNYPGDGDVDFDLPRSCPEGSPSVNLAVNRKLESLHSTSVAVVDSSRLSPCYAYTENKIDVCPDENVLNEKSTDDDIDMDVPAFGRCESPPANLKVNRKLTLSSLKLAAKDSETLPSCSEYIENRSSISAKDANSDERRSDTELHQANTVDASDIENQIADDNDDDFSKSDESNDLFAGLHNKENDFVMSSIKQQKERIPKYEKSLYLVSPLRRTPSAFEKTFVTPELKEIEEDADENTYSSKLVETDGEEADMFCDKQGQQDKQDEGYLNEYDHYYQDNFYGSDQNDNGDFSTDGDKNYTGRHLYDVDHNGQRVRSRDDSDNGHENAKGDSLTDTDQNYECDHFDTSLIDNDFPPSPELIEEAPESPCLVTLKYQCEHAENPSERETSETEQEDIESPGNTKINSFDEGIDEGNSTGVRSQFDASLSDNSVYVVATSPKKSRLSVRSKESRTTVRCGDMATITGDASHHAQSLLRPSVNTSTPLKRKNISVNSLESSDSDQQLKLSTNSPSKKKLKTSKGSKRSKEAFKALLKKAAGCAECEGSLSERATSCSEAEPTIPDISCGVVQVKRSSYRFRKVPLLEKERGKSRESPLRMPMKSGSHTQLCSERTMNVSESATIVRNSIESGSNSCQSNISSPEDDDLESGLENSNYRNDEHLCEIVNESRDLNVSKCSKTENSCCSEPEIVEGQRVLDKPGIRKMSGANEAARSLEESRTSKKRLYAEFLRSFDEDSSLNEASGSDGTVCERKTDEFEKSTAERTSTRLNTSEDACKDSHRNIRANVENDSVSGMNSACSKVDDCFESKFDGIGPLGNIADVDDSTASIVSFSRCQENFSYRVNENVEGNKNAIEECESGEDPFTSDRVFFEEDYSGLVYAEGCPKTPDIRSMDENMDLNNDACFNDFEPECFIDDGGFNCDMAENMAFDSRPGSSCLQNVSDGSSRSSLENLADASKEPGIESPCVTSFKYKRKIANRPNCLETSNNERSSRKSLQNSDVMNIDGRNCEAEGNSTDLFTSGASDDDVVDQSQIRVKGSNENKENLSICSRIIVSTVSHSGNEDMKSISSGRYLENESPSVCIANDTDESSDLYHSDGGSTQDAEASNEEIDKMLMLASGTPSTQAKINQPNIPVVRTPHTALRNFGPGCTVHPETNLPITPMTDYSALETPVLTKRVKVFGMRKLPKRKMVGKLKEIFKAQHGFKNWEEAPPKLKRKRKKETGAKGKKDSKAKKPSGIETETADCRDSDRDSEGYSSSTDQRRKTFEGQLESDTDSLSQSSQTEKEESLFDKLLHFIQNHAELYEKALTYQKFDFVELHKMIKDSGMKCSKNRLADFLDEQCICYIFPKSSDKRNARRKRGPKPKKAKHVEI